MASFVYTVYLMKIINYLIVEEFHLLLRFIFNVISKSFVLWFVKDLYYVIINEQTAVNSEQSCNKFGILPELSTVIKIKFRGHQF